MESSNKHTAQWLAGTSLALVSSHSTQAATVMIDFTDHDLTSTFAGLSLFNGIDSNNSWNRYTRSVTSSTVYKYVWNKANNVIAGGSYSPFGYYAGAGSENGVRNKASHSTEVNVSGLVEWELSNGTKGWLHINTLFNNTETSMTADYFVFDDANDQVRPDHGGDSEAFVSVATTTLNAQAAPVPEPSSLALLALGAAGVMTRRRKN